MANMMQLRGLLLENSATLKILRPHLFKSSSSCRKNTDVFLRPQHILLKDIFACEARQSVPWPVRPHARSWSRIVAGPYWSDWSCASASSHHWFGTWASHAPAVSGMGSPLHFVCLRNTHSLNQQRFRTCRATFCLLQSWSSILI